MSLPQLHYDPTRKTNPFYGVCTCFVPATYFKTHGTLCAACGRQFGYASEVLRDQFGRLVHPGDVARVLETCKCGREWNRYCSIMSNVQAKCLTPGSVSHGMIEVEDGQELFLSGSRLAAWTSNTDGQ